MAQIILRETFPRKLNDIEKFWLYSILPEDKSGYKLYRDEIDKKLMIGYGRFGGGNRILGDSDSVIDLDIPSSPVFAVGGLNYKNIEVYISIHEQFENMIEIDIKKSSEENFEFEKPVSKWSYSDWRPGNKAPVDNSAIREINLIKDEFTIAVAALHKKIWIYNYKNGVNSFIPVSNFYNELMKVKHDRNPEHALYPNRLFTNLDEFTDEELKKGFVSYNKYFKHMELDSSKIEFNSISQSKNKKSIFGFFKN